MTTTVSYRDGKPAISVKLHVAGIDFWPDALLRLPKANGSHPIGETTAEDCIEAAYNIVQVMFWDEFAERAMATPLGRIHQDGRSGGWLVFEVDPTHGGEDDAPPIWLAAYAGLTAGIEAWLAGAPARVQRMAEQLAMDELGRAPAERAFAMAA